MRFHTELQPFVQVPWAAGISAIYVASVLGGAKVMQGFQPVSLKSVKLIYNLIQIVVCTAITVGLLPSWVRSASAQRFPEPSTDVEMWVFVYFCVKICDFGDTAFIVLEKRTRQLSLLHVWHHSSIVPLIAYFLSLGWGGGCMSILPLLNSIVHVVMYTHYLITSVATFENMWWKPWITRIQISQHAALILLMTCCYVTGAVEWPWPVTAVSILWGISILGLFVRFYLQQAQERRRKDSVGKMKKLDEPTKASQEKSVAAFGQGSINGTW
eukprot:CAMPEP_0178431900 /NCGR_PEP_ID=MMETSP0689_2-20121128/32101_1 /TAXON_ID=160604 /ORGANISM="Amphidinium massartii, Strain CS-259" /LENGTH=269 /DNA_ID=CAMNT_0020053857 /DNA_START=15 /DNA_END=821 /DNA_ORIENTATION=+